MAVKKQNFHQGEIENIFLNRYLKIVLHIFILVNLVILYFFYRLLIKVYYDNDKPAIQYEYKIEQNKNKYNGNRRL